MRFQSLDEELLPGDGVWPRDRLLAMDAFYTAAVERAFELGLESRAAASTTVRVTKQRLTGEQAIQEAWTWYCRNRDTADISSSEVVARVRAQYWGVDPMLIRAEFKKRFMACCSESTRSSC